MSRQEPTRSLTATYPSMVLSNTSAAPVSVDLVELPKPKSTKRRIQEIGTIMEFLLDQSSLPIWAIDADSLRPFYISPGFAELMGQQPESVTFSVWLRSVHAEDRDRVRQNFEKNKNRPYQDEYRISRPDGAIRWVRERSWILQNADGSWKIVRLAEDCTDVKRMENLVLDISGREQRRMGQDLHDGVCQTLIAIKYISRVLLDKLKGQAASSSGFHEVTEISTLVGQALTQADILAKGLSLVQIEENGFIAAFRELASNVMKLYSISCTLDWGEDSIQINDRFTSVQLYRIAQEAVHNAIKHGKAKHVVIGFSMVNGKTLMTIKDDGIGFSGPSQRKGMGLYLLHFRARKIGGTLAIEKGPKGGTVVTCSFLKKEVKNVLGRRREDQIVH